MAKGIHVVKHNDGWAGKQENSQRVSFIAETQAEAIARAREIAINHQEELFIHGKNGRIRERNSYGNDPFPPRG